MKPKNTFGDQQSEHRIIALQMVRAFMIQSLQGNQLMRERGDALRTTVVK